MEFNFIKALGNFFISLGNFQCSELILLENVESSPSEVFLIKGVLKICNKFTGEHPCRSAISIKLQGNFIVNLLHIFGSPFPKNTAGWLLLGCSLEIYNSSFHKNPAMVGFFFLQCVARKRELPRHLYFQVTSL